MIFYKDCYNTKIMKFNYFVHHLEWFPSLSSTKNLNLLYIAKLPNYQLSSLH